MRDDEEYISNCMVQYLIGQGFKNVDFTEPPKDPPDVIFNIDGLSYPAEITKVDENSVNGRTSYAIGYIRFIKSFLLKEKDRIPNDVSFSITVHHSSTKVGKIKKEFKKFWNTHLLFSNFKNDEYKFTQGGVEIKFSKLPFTGNRFPMIITNRSKSINRSIGKLNQYACQPLNQKLATIIQHCVNNKIEKCRAVTSPKWLILHDYFTNKFSASTGEQVDMYQASMRFVDGKEGFDRIYVVLEGGSVECLYADVQT